MRLWISLTSRLAMGLLALAALACREAAPPQPPPPPVRVAVAAQKTVPLDLRAVGIVDPVSTVEVKSQVEGSVSKVHFTEGQEVRAGDPLFTIDPRPFEAALAQARANLTRDAAQASLARAEAERQSKLFGQGVASKQQFDSYRTRADVDAGSARAGEATVRKAELDLEHTLIRSPLRGRTGSLNVHEGSVAKPNDTTLVIVRQIAPIDVRFSIPEQQLPGVQKAMAEGVLQVTAHAEGSPDAPDVGQLVFVDNTVDRTTGTISLKGRFENDPARLWPGQFVDVALRLGVRENALVIPDHAVAPGQAGDLVYVVDEASKVQARSVKVAFSHDGESVIDAGLAPGDRVVVDGQLRLAPGIAVEVVGEAEHTAKTSSSP
jgi:multidrug efflux system membrane fusion protein